MKKNQCKEALEIYKTFLNRMTKLSEFLKVAEVRSLCAAEGNQEEQEQEYQSGASFPDRSARRRNPSACTAGTCCRLGFLWNLVQSSDQFPGGLFPVIFLSLPLDVL